VPLTRLLVPSPFHALPSPVLSSLHRWLPLVLIATAALWLRTTELARRPMHADEANQAVKLGQLLDTGDYAFDPADHHGPTLYFLAVPLAWLRNETSLATLTETTVRLLPALAGTLAVLLLSALASPPTEPTANTPPHHSRLLPFTAAIFLTVSPPAVYYSRYFIQETLLLAFTLATFLFAQRWWRTAYLRWALLTGVSIGLMQATKASAPLFLLCAVLAALPLLLRRSPASPARASLPRHGLLALAAALFTAAIFYSSFFTHLAGLRDALATYTHASSRAVGETGHEKPFAYYFQLLAFHRAGGLTFHQIPFLALAAIGAFFAFRRHASPLLRWAALYTLLVALALFAHALQKPLGTSSTSSPASPSSPPAPSPRSARGGSPPPSALSLSRSRSNKPNSPPSSALPTPAIPTPTSTARPTSSNSAPSPIPPSPRPPTPSSASSPPNTGPSRGISAASRKTSATGPRRPLIPTPP